MIQDDIKNKSTKMNLAYVPVFDRSDLEDALYDKRMCTTLYIASIQNDNEKLSKILTTIIDKIHIVRSRMITNESCTDNYVQSVVVTIRFLLESDPARRCVLAAAHDTESKSVHDNDKRFHDIVNFAHALYFIAVIVSQKRFDDSFGRKAVNIHTAFMPSVSDTIKSNSSPETVDAYVDLLIKYCYMRNKHIFQTSGTSEELPFGKLLSRTLRYVTKCVNAYGFTQMAPLLSFGVLRTKIELTEIGVYTIPCTTLTQRRIDEWLATKFTQYSYPPMHFLMQPELPEHQWCSPEKLRITFVTKTTRAELRYSRMFREYTDNKKASTFYLFERMVPFLPDD
jgi:hypothetical protein